MDHRGGAHEPALVHGAMVAGHKLQPVHPFDDVFLAIVAQRVQTIQYVQADECEVQYGQPRVIENRRLAGQQVQRASEILFVLLGLELRLGHLGGHLRPRGIYQLTTDGRADMFQRRPTSVFARWTAVVALRVLREVIVHRARSTCNLRTDRRTSVLGRRKL